MCKKIAMILLLAAVMLSPACGKNEGSYAEFTAYYTNAVKKAQKAGAPALSPEDQNKTEEHKRKLIQNGELIEIEIEIPMQEPRGSLADKLLRIVADKSNGDLFVTHHVRLGEKDPLSNPDELGPIYFMAIMPPGLWGEMRQQIRDAIEQHHNVPNSQAVKNPAAQPHE